MMVDAARKLVSFVVPVLNEEENVGPLYDAVVRTIGPLQARYDFEFVFTDNHSSDATFEKLRQLAAGDRRVRAFRFSRNFGYQNSILFGYLNCRGDAAIQLDCDLQDPPQMIGDFLRHWENGYHVVYGVRRSRKEGAVITFARKLFYRLIDAVADDPLPTDAGDFRLIDRRMIDALRQVNDAQPYLRGLIATMGFRQLGIEYDRHERLRGKTKFALGSLVGLALDGIVNHSTIPLRIASIVGVSMSLLTAGGFAAYFLAKTFFGAEWPAGFTTITLLILLSISLNSLFLGVLGEYISRIYVQVKRRPTTIVEESIDGGSAERGTGSAERGTAIAGQAFAVRKSDVEDRQLETEERTITRAAG